MTGLANSFGFYTVWNFLGHLKLLVMATRTWTAIAFRLLTVSFASYTVKSYQSANTERELFYFDSLISYIISLGKLSDHSVFQEKF